MRTRDRVGDDGPWCVARRKRRESWFERTSGRNAFSVQQSSCSGTRTLSTTTSAANLRRARVNHRSRVSTIDRASFARRRLARAPRLGKRLHRQKLVVPPRFATDRAHFPHVRQRVRDVGRVGVRARWRQHRSSSRARTPSPRASSRRRAPTRTRARPGARDGRGDRPLYLYLYVHRLRSQIIQYTPRVRTTHRIRVYAFYASLLASRVVVRYP